MPSEIGRCADWVVESRTLARSIELDPSQMALVSERTAKSPTRSLLLCMG
jgi:hypothetical protein